MKLLSIFLLITSPLLSQYKIDFRDGKSLVLRGKQAGSFVKYNFFDATIVDQNYQNYTFLDGDTIEISVYKAWKDGRMDDLFVYRIHQNQINQDYTEIYEDLDDNGKLLSYRLPIVAADEQAFLFRKYNIYSSVGEARRFNTFTIESNQKEGLEEILKMTKK